ncbi:hypothetical protein CJ030_MR5G020822 [Morella rubra]|uniref:Uncharacterized protein n=1 Tax=Morella rubra TaxID=262757 RepID=A0A6A1VNC1_9ROSI|nr:hypothetical protein CJ030_MR5G020822 [Morella rubra]
MRPDHQLKHRSLLELIQQLQNLVRLVLPSQHKSVHHSLEDLQERNLELLITAIAASQPPETRRETTTEGQGLQPMELPAKTSRRKRKDMSEGQTRMTGGSQPTQLRRSPRKLPVRPTQ